MKFLNFSHLILALNLLTGCSLFIGNIKPVDEKSESYRSLNLSQVDADWTQLASDESSDVSSADVQDVAFQSKRTSSIISLNSACRAAPESSKQNLEELTRSLLLGFTNRGEIEEKAILVDGQKAMQTTLDGDVSSRRVRLRAIVTRKGICAYDLMYVARPADFQSQEPTFTRFVNELKLGN